MKLLNIVVILSFALVGCAQAGPVAQVDCPDKYEGQTVTIEGKITKTGSFLGLANLTTLEDSKRGICVVISKKNLGNEGEKVRLENMVAVKATNTVVPNFLRTVEDASLFTPGGAAASAGASARASAIPTLDLTSTRKVGQSVSYAGSWKVTAVKIEELVANSALAPKPGMRLVVVTVRYDNGGTKEIAFSASDWKLQDGSGAKRDPLVVPSRTDTLQRGVVAPGSLVNGTLVFEVPTDDKKLSALYQATGYNPTSWELY